jgi:large subunit ribosomal protein L1
MNNQTIIKALQTAKEQSKERKFSQTVDLIIALRGLNLKKPEEQVEFFVNLPHGVGKKRKVCAFVGPELEEKAKEVCDFVITQPEYAQYKEKKAVKKLAKSYDFFIAQADIMPKVAAAFGKALGPRGKMPNPKAGCILPPKAPVQPLYDRLQKIMPVIAKKQLGIQFAVGKDDMNETEIAENISTIYNQLLHHLPAEKNNIKSVYLKLTMSKPVKIE